MDQHTQYHRRLASSTLGRSGLVCQHLLLLRRPRRRRIGLLLPGPQARCFKLALGLDCLHSLFLLRRCCRCCCLSFFFQGPQARCLDSFLVEQSHFLASLGLKLHLELHRSFFLCLDGPHGLLDSLLTPFYRSLVAAFFLLFLLAGWAYGKGAGSIGDHRDLVKMMTGAMEDLAYYLVLSFAAAHFVAMFAWSGLGLILAVHGADFLAATELPAWVLLTAIILISALLNLFVGSASAKWALIAPVMVPMLMLLGISPEMATAAYRVGDSATNIITPLMVYFPLILIFCQRWQQSFGLGSLAATMLPYSIGLMIAGLLMTIGWVVLDIPLGPGAGVFIDIPAANITPGD